MLHIMVFTASYYIIQPPNDNYVQIVPVTAEMFILTCSLNVNIPAGMMITWLYNGQVIITATSQFDQNINYIVLLRGGSRLQAGVYQCVFNNTAGYILRRNITLLGM